LYALQFENYAVPVAFKQGLLAKMAGGEDTKHYEEISKKFAESLDLPTADLPDLPVDSIPFGYRTC